MCETDQYVCLFIFLRNPMGFFTPSIAVKALSEFSLTGEPSSTPVAGVFPGGASLYMEELAEEPSIGMPQQGHVEIPAIR